MLVTPPVSSSLSGGRVRGRGREAERRAGDRAERGDAMGKGVSMAGSVHAGSVEAGELKKGRRGAQLLRRLRCLGGVKFSVLSKLTAVPVTCLATLGWSDQLIRAPGAQVDGAIGHVGDLRVAVDVGHGDVRRLADEQVAAHRAVQVAAEDDDAGLVELHVGAADLVAAGGGQAHLELLGRRDVAERAARLGAQVVVERILVREAHRRAGGHGRHVRDEVDVLLRDHDGRSGRLERHRMGEHELDDHVGRRLAVGAVDRQAHGGGLRREAGHGRGGEENDRSDEGGHDGLYEGLSAMDAGSSRQSGRGCGDSRRVVNKLAFRCPTIAPVP